MRVFSSIVVVGLLPLNRNVRLLIRLWRETEDLTLG